MAAFNPRYPLPQRDLRRGWLWVETEEKGRKGVRPRLSW